MRYCRPFIHQPLITTLLWVILIGSIGSISAQPSTAQSTQPTPLASNGQLLRYGERITGQLSLSQPTIRYRFNGTAGDQVFIALAAEFDTLVYLLDPQGNEIASDDDGGYNRTSLISAFTLPTDGVYLAAVTSFNSNAEGTFGLVIEEAGTIRQVGLGEELEGEATGLVGLFSVAGETGDYIVVSLQAGGVDTGLALYDPSGARLITSNSASGGSARVGPARVNSADAYLVFAAGVGNYRIRFQRAQVQPVALGEIVTGQFTASTTGLYYTFAGERNQIIDLTVSSGNRLDTRMTLISPDGYEIAYSTDFPGLIDPGINQMRLERDGEYLILIEPADAAVPLNGGITLTLQATELRSLEDGTARVAMDANSSQQSLTFNGMAGDVVRLTFVFIEGDPFANPYVDVVQGGFPMVTLNLRGMDRIAFDFTLTADGPVLVNINSFNTVVFEVSLERMAP